MVDTYSYLGVHHNNKLDCKVKSQAAYRKGMSKLYFLKKLRCFKICSNMLKIFYQSVIASAVVYAGDHVQGTMICWGELEIQKD